MYLCCGRTVYYTDFKDSAIDGTAITPVESDQVEEAQEEGYTNPMYADQENGPQVDLTRADTTGNDDLDPLYSKPIKPVTSDKKLTSFFNIDSKLIGPGEYGETIEVTDFDRVPEPDHASEPSEEDTSLTDLSSSPGSSKFLAPPVPPKLEEPPEDIPVVVDDSKFVTTIVLP